MLNPERAGENLVIAADGTTATQTGQTQNFEGAWVLGTAGLTRGRWVCDFKIKRRKRWMAVGYALDTLKLNRPINRANIFVYASTGSIKANEHTREIESETDDGDTTQETNSAWSAFGSQYKTNDVIRAHLDMDLGVLGFSLNESTGDAEGYGEPNDAVRLTCSCGVYPMRGFVRRWSKTPMCDCVASNFTQPSTFPASTTWSNSSVNGLWTQSKIRVS